MFERMNHSSCLLFAGVVVAICSGAAALAQFSVEDMRLTIHVDQPLHAVSPMLYRLMTEEINYSYDGGLYVRWCATGPFTANLTVRLQTGFLQRWAMQWPPM